MNRYLSMLKFYVFELPYARFHHHLLCRFGRHAWYASMWTMGRLIQENCRYCTAERKWWWNDGP
jgi:hypothetical protein